MKPATTRANALPVSPGKPPVPASPPLSPGKEPVPAVGNTTGVAPFLPDTPTPPRQRKATVTQDPGAQKLSGPMRIVSSIVSSQDALGKRDTQPQRAKPHVTHHVALLSGNTAVQTTLDTSGQHLLTWNSSIMLDGVTLPAASCNLYQFPLCSPVASGPQFMPSGTQLEALKQLLIALATDELCPFFTTPDEVGALIMHAFVVGNTETSLELAAEIYRKVPKLVAQTHAMHRGGVPLFVGESSLHICCVNRREDLLCELLQIALDNLSRKEVAALLSSQASGIFFHESPMRWYGGTTLAYACCFGLRKAVHAMLASGIVSFNDTSSSCKLTGMLPLHIVAANGHRSMYDWMTLELPEAYRADTTVLARVGSLVSLGLYRLNPMQVAVRLGDHKTAKHLLRKQCSVLWKWGPITQYSICLSGVDSAGSGSGDVMELVGRFDAAKETTTMLLDSFLRGFIYQLFRQKWVKFGSRIHYARCLIDILGLFCLIYTAMCMKVYPSLDSQRDLRPFAIAILCITAFGVEEELRRARLFWKNEAGKTMGAGLGALSNWTLAKQTISFVHNHGGTTFMLAAGWTTVSCLLLLFFDFPKAAEDESVDLLLSMEGTLFGDHKGHESVSSLREVHIEPYGDGSEEMPGLLWLSLSLSILFWMAYIAQKLFTPFESLNIFLLITYKVLFNDFVVFLYLFVYIFCCSYFTLFVLFPRTTGPMPFMEPMNTWFSSFEHLMGMALVGYHFSISLDPKQFESMSYLQAVDFAVFYIGYYFYVLLACVLLMNLLVAMLSFTFVETRLESALQNRTAFAKFVLQLELQAEALGMDVQAGEPRADGSRAFDFRAIQCFSSKSRGIDNDGHYGAGVVSEGGDGGSNVFEDVSSDLVVADLSEEPTRH
jgi:hypothetical protein